MGIMTIAKRALWREGAVTMNELQAEARVFLKEFESQPEEVRRIFIFAVCQTMAKSGMLELLGAFQEPGKVVILIYRNPDTREIFEIVKPRISADEERAMEVRIQELLQENAHAA